MKNKGYIEWYTWDMLRNAAHHIGDKIKEEDQVFDNITTIARGGLVLASLLSYKLNIPRVYVVIPDVYYPEIDFEQTLFVDEIIDTGVTLQKLIMHYNVVPKKTASLHKGKDSIIEPDYYINTPQGWVIYPWEMDEYEEETLLGIKGDDF